MKVKGYPEDAQIRYIANIFKFKHLKSWNLKVCIRNNGQDHILHTRLSNLPAIAKRRFINPSDGQPRKGGYPMNLQNISTSNWQESDDSEGGGKTFVFDHIRSDGSIITVHIPQIEFARVLFFHNAYLARNCIDHNILKREFNINHDYEDCTLIDVLPICTVPLRTFDSYGQRRLLAWVLLDKNARESYESIAKRFIEQAVEVNNIKSWNFQFDCPSLDSISLQTSGWFDKKTNNYHVHEILDISDIETALSKKVKFYSKKFKFGAQSKGKGGTATGYSTQDNNIINDQNDADIDTKVKKLNIPKTTFRFSNPIETSKVVRRKAGGGLDSNKSSIDDFEEIDLNTDEAVIDGTACQADFAGLDDQTEDLDLYMQRFEAFKLLIKILSERPDVECSETLHFFPAVGRSRLHETVDGNRRTLLEVKITKDNDTFVILEIDTSDNVRLMSTLIIKINDIELWNSQLDKTLVEIVKRSLHWPTDKSLKKFGDVTRLIHPKKEYELLESSVEFLRWQKRLNDALNVN